MIIENIDVRPEGTLTLSKEVQHELGIAGKRNLILICENGEAKLVHPAIYALRFMNQALEGEAEKAGLDTEEKIIDFVREIRAEIEAE